MRGFSEALEKGGSTTGYVIDGFGGSDLIDEIFVRKSKLDFGLA